MVKRRKRMPASRIRRALAKPAIRNRRSMSPYDGVLGLPPAWMPSPLVHEFVSVRDQLLDAHPIEVVRPCATALHRSNKTSPTV